MDYKLLTDTELRDIVSAVTSELNRRAALENVEKEVNRLNQQYLTATGIQSGADWRQPSGAHDAYPQGFVVEHNGKRWTNLVMSNPHEPGVSGWREIAQPGEPAPEWVQPSGAHDSYGIGHRVTFEGREYISLIANNAHSPSANPAGWQQVVVEPEPEEPTEPEPEEPTEPEEPSYPEFVQPTGGHDAYEEGDRVIFEGKIYESLIPANAYSPSAYPAGWKEIIE